MKIYIRGIGSDCMSTALKYYDVPAHLEPNFEMLRSNSYDRKINRRL